MDRLIFADSIVSAAALFGLMILVSSIKRSGRDSISRRFLFSLYIIQLLLFFRILTWVTGIWLFDALTFMTAGVLPLGMIILTEGLLRRHASKLVKMIAAGTAIAFIPLAFLPEGFAEPWRSVLLLAAQLWGFFTAGYMVWTRDKESLSSAENIIIERIALSIPLIIPLIITDFRIPDFESPVRLSGVAILFMCLLTVSLERSHLKNSDMLRAFLILLSGSIFAGIAISYLVDTDLTGYIQICVITLSATMVAVVYNDSISLRFDERRDSLLKHMAEGNINSSATFLRGLQDHPLVEGAVILEEEDLEDFDHKLLKSVFEGDALQRKNDMSSANSSAEAEHLDWLFERFNATHVILVSNAPLSLVALNMPSLSASPGAETELRAVQRMAILISQRKSAK
jgi:hypothetical protein